MKKKIKATTIFAESVVISSDDFDYLMTRQDVIESQEREIHALLDRVEDLKRELQEARK